MSLTVDHTKRVLNALVENRNKLGHFRYPGVLKFTTNPWAVDDQIPALTFPDLQGAASTHFIYPEHHKAWYETMRRNHLFRDYLELLWASPMQFEFVVVDPPLGDLRFTEAEMDAYKALFAPDEPPANFPFRWLGDESRFDDWLTFHRFFSGLNQGRLERQRRWELYHPVYEMSGVHDIADMRGRVHSTPQQASRRPGKNIQESQDVVHGVQTQR